MNNYIYTYYQSICSGEACVGKWIKKVYEYIIHGLENKEFYFNPKKANLAINAIEKFTHHSEGALAPGRVKLELWQKALVSCVFGIVDETGKRQFTEIFTVVGRKNGKTLLASGIAQKCMFFDNEYGARIYFSAPKLEQANLCFQALEQSIQHEPILNNLAKKRRTDIYVQQTNTTAKPLAFSAKKSDGLNVSLAICDEIASWQGDAGLKFYEVIKSSQGARKEPLIFAMTTAGYINDGVYDELYARATRFLKGDSKEKHFLPFIYQIDDVTKWNDINELQKANPNLNVSVSVDYMLNEIAIAEQSLSKKYEFLTKYCNIKQNSSTAFLDTTDIEKCSGEHIDPTMFRNKYALIGIDLSRTTDLSCATCVIENKGKLNVLAKFFMPTEKLEEATATDGIPYKKYVERGELQLSGDNFIDYHDVYRWCCELIEEYKIYPLCVGYDRYSANYLIQDLNNYGFKTDDVFQGYNCSSTLREMEGLFKDATFNIGDNQLLKIHLLNGAVKMDNESEKMKLVKIGQYEHIDGFAALVDAMVVRQKYFNEIGIQLKNKE